jgi:hypothetical protein
MELRVQEVAAYELAFTFACTALLGRLTGFGLQPQPRHLNIATKVSRNTVSKEVYRQQAIFHASAEVIGPFDVQRERYFNIA